MAIPETQTVIRKYTVNGVEYEVSISVWHALLLDALHKIGAKV